MSTTKTTIEVQGPMHATCHPGELLAEEPEAARVERDGGSSGARREPEDSLVDLNGHAGVTAPMAMRFAKAFGSTPEFWLRLQMQRDLWDARRTRTAGIKRLVREVA